ncbi:hypothetical protein B0H14DRAFT_3130885 [Mycena olivaceomarginata]|nr:hypothetical protein B0H14DRAFT_3130885 [Mycena olivaceomarginata]
MTRSMTKCLSRLGRSSILVALKSALRCVEANPDKSCALLARSTPARSSYKIQLREIALTRLPPSSYLITGLIYRFFNEMTRFHLSHRNLSNALCCAFQPQSMNQRPRLWATPQPASWKFSDHSRGYQSTVAEQPLSRSSNYPGFGYNGPTAPE